MEQELEPIVWMRRPNDVERLITPIVWTMLIEKFSLARFDTIRWLCDSTFRPLGNIPPVLGKIQDLMKGLNAQRGYNSFVQHFDKYMEFLFSLKEFKNKKGGRVKKGEIDPLYQLINENRDRIFSDYLPLPNRSLLVIEETNMGTYVDPITTGAIDAIKTMIGLL